MRDDFAPAFSALKKVLAAHASKLAIKTDRPSEYTLVTKTSSPFPQHKGEPLFFAMVRRGKTGVSFHLLPLYMNPKLVGTVPSMLKKRMTGKACFTFKTEPDPKTAKDLSTLIAAALKSWQQQKWL